MFDDETVAKINKNRAEFDIIRADPTENTFEIGFVLGGTVSVGSYTAGALDLFFEAVDAWYEDNNGDPPHKILLSHIGGSSGGAVCAALTTVASNRQFQHVRCANGPCSTRPANPFWDLWVEQFDFKDFVSGEDLLDYPPPDDGDMPPFGKKQNIFSLLNSNAIDKARDKIVDYSNNDIVCFQRKWINNVLNTVITVGNLRGIPFRANNGSIAGTFGGAVYTEHDDYCWFSYLKTDDANVQIRPDSFRLCQGRGPFLKIGQPSVGFEVLADWAVASSALPVGLRARRLSRPAEHYMYRPFVHLSGVSNNNPCGNITATLYCSWLEPYWAVVEDTGGNPLDVTKIPYSFVGVDGGTFNNDPVKLVHQGLAGIVGRNPTGSDKARRALFMIDPLATTPQPNRMNGESMLSIAGQIMGAYTQESRYLTADLDLFADSNVFSRFQLVPSRSTGTMQSVGGDVLAGSDFFSVLDWCSKDFRVHDYLLGRHNMLNYLKNEFVLQASNKIFDKWYCGGSQSIKSAYQKFAPPNGVKGASRCTYDIPIIPIAPARRDFEAGRQPEWPVDKLDPRQVRDQLKQRLTQIAERLVKDNNLIPGVFRNPVNNILRRNLDDVLNAIIKGNLSKSLFNKNLIDKMMIMGLRNDELL